MKNKNLWVGIGLAAAVSLGIAAVKRQRRLRAQRWNRAMASQPKSTALVTGASSGIGAAYATKLASLGYDLVLVARRGERLKALANDLQSRYVVKAEYITADLSTEEGIRRVEQRITELGSIDFLVNSAGYDVFGDFAEIPIEQNLGLINCNTIASVRFCRAVLPGMLARGYGAIVNVSSIGALVPKPKDATYCAAKAYLNMFSKSLQMELAATQIHVQALCPGFTLTEFHDHPQYNAFEVKKRILAWMWMKPEQVVESSVKALSEGQVEYIPGVLNRLITTAGQIGLTGFLMDLLHTFLVKPQAVPLKRATLDLLACPHCHSQLILSESSPTGDLVSGTLACPQCGKQYPIVDGIPHFSEYKELTGQNRRFSFLYDWFSYIYRPFSKIAFAYIGASEDECRREIIDRLGAERGRVLEISIGPGVNLPFLVGVPGVSEVYGLDISLGQLKRCRSYTQDKGWSVDLFLGNAEELPFKDGMFDSVLHIGGINFFNDQQKAINEMIRVAKPGAKIVISDETERGARGYETVLPGFKQSYKEPRAEVTPPIDLVPPEMKDIRLDTNVWRGWFYCIDFKKPLM
jgi:short-subunit dehydrogenase/ubiquinone/menaquinone biosynthesis C-methylase UbiE/uncharacterized protein YbaR (Trm112 family)